MSIIKYSCPNCHYEQYVSDEVDSYNCQVCGNVNVPVAAVGSEPKSNLTKQEPSCSADDAHERKPFIDSPLSLLIALATIVAICMLASHSIPRVVADVLVYIYIALLACMVIFEGSFGGCAGRVINAVLSFTSVAAIASSYTYGISDVLATSLNFIAIVSAVIIVLMWNIVHWIAHKLLNL